MNDDEKAAPKPVPVGTAAAGWRVIYFLRKDPWVREEPVAAFHMDNPYLAYPMVREAGQRFIQKVDTEDDYALAAPGEPAEAFIEEAKESARQHRAWLAVTREKRKEERETQKRAWEYRRQMEEYEATGRSIPADHPARPLLEGRSLLSRAREEDAPSYALAWFLAWHAAFSTDGEVARSKFEDRFGSFLTAYELPRPDSATLLRLMQRVKHIETFKYKGKVDGWKGLCLRDDAAEEARPLDPDTPEARSVAAAVFRAHCIAKAQSWQTWGVPQSGMLTAFRVWCIGYRLQPWPAREILPHVRPWAQLSKTPDARTGERQFEGVVVSLPKPGERTLRPGRGRGRRAE